MAEQTERLLLRPGEAAEAIGVSRAKVYALINAGDLPSIKVGDSLRIPVAALRAWVDKKVEEAATAGAR